MPRIVVVFGATGNQGSAVVDALLADKTFSPRAVTRNASSEAARQLAARGVEVVTGDLWDKESIKQALTGCEGVFGVTNYYDPSIVGANPKGEVDQGKLLIDTAKEVGVKFFVWSGLPHTTNLSNGKYPGVNHFDNKAEVEEYLKKSGLPNATVYTGWFCENVWKLNALSKVADGTYELSIPRYSPTATNALLWVQKDLGGSVLALLKHYQDRADEILNKTFYVANAHITFPGFAKILSKTIGKPVKFTAPPTTGMYELDVMYDFQSDIGLFRHSELPDPRLVALGVKFGTLEEFAEQCVKPRFS